MYYKKTEEQIKKIIDRSSCILQDVVDFLYNTINRYSWVGIYIVQGNELVLGPWKGPNATEHTRITIGKGVCGEIVVPIKKEGKIIGEIDIDSDKIGAFTIKDKIFLEKIADMLSEHI